MSKMGPLSLEGQCFLYILLNLDVFPWFHLALLPQKMRSKLLRTLPLADVFQLQGTAVINDIKMDEVWRELCNSRLPMHFLDLPKCLNAPIQPQELLSIAAVYASLHDQRAVTANESHRSNPGIQTSPSKTWMLYENLLFMVPTPSALSAVSKALSTEVVEVACRIIPQRYAQFKASTYTVHDSLIRSRVLEFLVRYASVQNLEYSYFDPKVFTDPVISTCKRTLQQVLCGVNHMSLVCNTGTLTYRENTIPNVLKCLPPNRLNTLTIVVDYQDRSDSFMSATCTSLTGRDPEIVQNNIKNVRVISRDRSDRLRNETIHEIASHHLQTTIVHQGSLETLHVENWWCRSVRTNRVILMQGALCSLFLKPSFVMLRLTDVCIPESFIQDLLHAFLLSPCTQLQDLILEDIELVDGPSANYHNTIPTEMIYEGSIIKCLTFTVKKGTHTTRIQSTVDILSTVKNIRLKSIVTNAPQFLNCIVQHPNAVIEDITLKGANLSDPKTSNLISTLFSFSRDLKQLEIECVDVTPPQVVAFMPALVSALQRQAKLGSLRQITLSGFQLGATHLMLSELFEAFFSLPQFAQMIVTIKDGLNHAQRETMSKVYKSKYPTAREQEVVHDIGSYSAQQHEPAKTRKSCA